MANSQELFEQIKDLFVQFEDEHNGSSKAAKSRARKAIGEIKKLVTDYRLNHSNIQSTIQKVG